MRGLLASIGLLLGVNSFAFAQPAAESDAPAIRSGLADLQKAISELKKKERDERLVADVEIYAKAVEWALRHDEFYLPKPPTDGSKPKIEPKSKYPQYALNAIKTGLKRVEELAAEKSSWTTQTGKSIRGYVSRVDGLGGGGGVLRGGLRVAPMRSRSGDLRGDGRHLINLAGDGGELRNLHHARLGAIFHVEGRDGKSRAAECGDEDARGLPELQRGFYLQTDPDRQRDEQRVANQERPLGDDHRQRHAQRGAARRVGIRGQWGGGAHGAGKVKADAAAAKTKVPRIDTTLHEP